MVDPSTVRITGALAEHRHRLWDALLAAGYAPLSAMNLLRLTAHLGRWLDEQKIPLKKLTPECMTAFFELRRRVGYTQFLTPRSLAPILQYLEEAGVVRLGTPTTPPLSALDRLIGDYREYLRHERGLAATSVRAYGDIGQRFLQVIFSEKRSVAKLKAGDVTSFVLEASTRYSIGTTKYIVTVLRSMLRYLFLQGQLAADLTGAIPAVSGWRLQGLPKALDPSQVRLLLRACDRRRLMGRRDYAVLLLLVRLGLRKGEVAALELDDIDWQAGEFQVCGKGGREERLPLPADVGEALAAYLHRNRPQTGVRQVFLGVRAPYRPLQAGAISAVACAALKRAGLPASNTHRLRHTAATQMLRAGASLDEVAQVLRHRSHDTTAIYAKVDHGALRQVIQPWPGGAS